MLNVSVGEIELNYSDFLKYYPFKPAFKYEVYFDLLFILNKIKVDALFYPYSEHQLRCSALAQFTFFQKIFIFLFLNVELIF